MATEDTLTAQPYVVHIPDEYSSVEVADGADWPLGAGFYEFGFEVNGARFPLARLKGGGVKKKLKAAKEARDSSTPPPAPAPEAQPAPPAPDTQTA